MFLQHFTEALQKMKSRCLSLFLTALLLTQSGSMPALTAIQEQCKVGTPSKAMIEFKAYMEARKKSFQAGKQMLLAYGLPFNPDLLIDENWRTLLEPAFSRMPEMKQVIKAPALLKGVIIAHKLTQSGTGKKRLIKFDSSFAVGGAGGNAIHNRCFFDLLALSYLLTGR